MAEVALFGQSELGGGGETFAQLKLKQSVLLLPATASSFGNLRRSLPSAAAPFLIRFRGVHAPTRLHRKSFSPQCSVATRPKYLPAWSSARYSVCAQKEDFCAHRDGLTPRLPNRYAGLGTTCGAQFASRRGG
jgi:hypothetical protein